MVRLIDLLNMVCACAAGDQIELEYNQPAMPVPGQEETVPILRVASVMHVRVAQRVTLPVSTGNLCELSAKTALLYLQ